VLVVSDKYVDTAATLEQLTANLFKFQQCGYRCDTVLVTDDGHVKAHSVVLAAVSPVFKRSLKSTDEPVQYTIVLPGMQLFFVKVVILFVYTGKITEGGDVTNILSAIDDFEIKLQISRCLFHIYIFTLPQTRVQSIVMSMSVCLQYTRWPNLAKFFVHVADGCVSVLLWRHIHNVPVWWMKLYSQIMAVRCTMCIPEQR